MRRWATVVLAAGFLAAGGCGHRAPMSLTHSSVLAKAGLTSYWELPLDLQRGERIQRIELLEENLYCLTNTNYIIAVDAARGVRKWARQVANPGAKVYPLCHAAGVPLWRPKEEPATRPFGQPPPMPPVNLLVHPPGPDSSPPADLVFVNTPDHVLAFDRSNGELMRKITFDSKPQQFVANTGGACDGRYFYVGSADGRCYCIAVSEGTISWFLPTDDILTAAPRCHNPGGSPRVFFAGEDASYYIAKSGPPLSLVWPTEAIRPWPDMAGPVTTEFHVDDRAVFIPCANQRVYAFPLGGGPPIWRFTCDGVLSDPIQVSENSVFQYARGGKLHAINPANGKPRWSMGDGRKVLAVMPGPEGTTAYIVDGGKNLLVVDEILGAVRASIPLTGVDMTAGNTTAPAVYLAARNGRLYCLRQLGAAPLTSDMLRKTKAAPTPVGPPRPPQTQPATAPAAG